MVAILICTVSEESWNDKLRLSLLKKLLEEAKRRKVDLVVLPGGYFRTRHKPENHPILPDIIDVIQTNEIAVCFGIDAAEKVINKKKLREHESKVKEGMLPWFGYVYTPSDGCLGPWQQRSAINSDAEITPIKISKEKRIFYIGEEKRRVALLMCGEVFNSKIRNHIIEYQNVDIVVDLVHNGHGFRFHHVPQNWPECYIFMSCHVKTKNATKRWGKKGDYYTERKTDFSVVEKEAFIEARIIKVP